MKIVTALLGLWIGVMLGAGDADRATLRDCATKGTANMIGGGSIKCEVIREKGQS